MRGEARLNELVVLGGLHLRTYICEPCAGRRWACYRVEAAESEDAELFGVKCCVILCQSGMRAGFFRGCAGLEIEEEMEGGQTKRPTVDVVEREHADWAYVISMSCANPVTLVD